MPFAENNRRRAAVAAGTVRCFIAARCPSPDLPPPPPPAAWAMEPASNSPSWTRCSRSTRGPDPRPRQDPVPAGLRPQITEPVGLGSGAMIDTRQNDALTAR